MFRSHTDHLQPSLLDTVTQLSDARQQRLAESWAGTFYDELFCRLDETPFAVLYADCPSRPNTPVNQLVGIEILKSGHGWSDEELFDHLNFDLQTRYALGVRDLETVICTPRTIYNFRRRVSAHLQATGENLFAQAFAQVTAAQCHELQVDTRRQRMDSTQIASNIRQYSRLRLVVEVLQRALRMLRAADQERYAARLQPYRQGNAGHYCYRLPRDTYAQHLAQTGQVIAELLTAWAPTYAEDPAYQLLHRVFHEHFTVADPAQPTEIRVKPPAELRATSLQAPDDLEATYRQKNGQGYRGYVANVTETCLPGNPVQLVTHLQVAPNATDDETLLVAALPELQAHFPLTELDLDGGYNGAEATRAAADHRVTLHPSALRGATPEPEHLSWAAFTWELPPDAPGQVTCPQGYTVLLRPGRNPGRYLADFDAATCATCPLRDRCPTQPLQRRPARVARVSQRQIEVAQQRQDCAATQAAGPPYLRPAVEATVRSLKHPFGVQLPVRGLARVTLVLWASGFMINVRRIWRYQRAKDEDTRQKARQERQNTTQKSVGARCQALFRRWSRRLAPPVRRVAALGLC